MDWFHLILPLALFLVLLIGAGRWYMRRAHQKACDEYSRKYPGKLPLRVAPANFFGLASQGMTQIRGNGSLFLTEDRLVFRMIVPNRWIEVPIAGIQRMENPRSFLGRTKGRKLLAVHFRDTERGDNSAAWLVSDLDGWTDDLRRISQS